MRDVAREQFGMALRAGPALATHVPHVVGGRAEEEVVGVAAARVVANVAGEQFARPPPGRQPPRDAVGGIAPALDVDASVPRRALAGGPLPASGRLADLGPEPGLELGRARRLRVARGFAGGRRARYMRRVLRPSFRLADRSFRS